MSAEIAFNNISQQNARQNTVSYENQQRQQPPSQQQVNRPRTVSNINFRRTEPKRKFQLWDPLARFSVRNAGLLELPALIEQHQKESMKIKPKTVHPESLPYNISKLYDEDAKRLYSGLSIAPEYTQWPSGGPLVPREPGVRTKC
jgi:hypothetical protein